MTHAVIDIFENSIRTYCRTKADGVVRVAQTIHNKFHVICHLNDVLNTCARLNPARRWGGSSAPSRARSSCCSSAGLGCEVRPVRRSTRSRPPQSQALKAHLLKESLGYLWDYTKGRA